jgi:hypothetical protein
MKVALAAASELEKEDISAEVIDLRKINHNFFVFLYEFHFFQYLRFLCIFAYATKKPAFKRIAYYHHFKVAERK